MKRNTKSELNHENWDSEEVPEERGTFLVADKEVISARKVITAKRKPQSNQSTVFKSFSGFAPNVSTTFNVPVVDNREKHLNNLKQLNKTFIENIQKFVTENNCCILSPLFDDYQKHLTTIRTKYPLPETLSVQTGDFMPIKSDAFVTKQKMEVDKPSLFNFKPTSISTVASLTPSTPLLFNTSNNDIKSSNVATAPQSLFLFGCEKPKENNATLFGGNMFTSQPQDTIVADNDEEYVPPKAETREVKESDSVFDIRCKLFYKVEQAWKEKGVGNIFIKPASSNKFQLVMRADNTLGSILLNVLMTKQMPMTLTANNVSIVAMTDFVGGELKPTPLLIRVKNADGAEKLLSAMKAQLE